MALSSGRYHPAPVPAPAAALTLIAPELKRRGAARVLTEAGVREIKPLRYARKIFDGDGLHLLVAPNGGRYWRLNYRFHRKSRTLAIGIYPDVSLEKARVRRDEAKRLLADGFDPSTRKQDLFDAARLRLTSRESTHCETKSAADRVS